MNKKLVLILVMLVLIVISLVLYFNRSEEQDFSVNAVLFKSVIKTDEGITNNLKITNLETKKTFRLSIKGIENLGLVRLSEESFEMDEDEEKNIEITFIADYFNCTPGVYVGALVIETGSKEKQIPLIIEVQPEGVLFATNLEFSPEYKDISPGNPIIAGIKIYNLKDAKTHTLEVASLIKNLDNEVIVSETENVIVGTETFLTKTITLPKNLGAGNYVFAVITKFAGEYGESVSTSSYLFSITKKTKIFKFDVDSFTIIFSIIVFIFLIGIVLLVVYVLHERDKLFLELRRQHTNEMKFYLEKIEERKRKKLVKIKKPKEKKKIIREFKKIKKAVKKKIREKQKKQKAIFKKLKKQKKTSEMKRKLEEWKNQGFNVNELMAISKPEKMKIEGAKEWKKQGYDTSILGGRKI